MSDVLPAMSISVPAKSPAKPLILLAAQYVGNAGAQNPAKSRKVPDFLDFADQHSPARKVPPLRGKAWRPAAIGLGHSPLWSWGRNFPDGDAAQRGRSPIPYATMSKPAPWRN